MQQNMNSSKHSVVEHMESLRKIKGSIVYVALLCTFVSVLHLIHSFSLGKYQVSNIQLFQTIAKPDNYFRQTPYSEKVVDEDAEYYDKIIRENTPDNADMEANINISKTLFINAQHPLKTTTGRVSQYYMRRYLGNIDVLQDPKSTITEKLKPHHLDEIIYDEKAADEFGVPLYFMNTWNPRHPSSKANQEVENGRLKLRKLIMRNQNPKVCERRRFCSCQHAKGLGLFSILHGRVLCLLGAILHDCTLVQTRDGSITVYQNEKACESYYSKWDCYFQELHSCPSELIEYKRRRGSIISLPYPLYQQQCQSSRPVMKTLLNRVGLKSELVAQSELLAWVMRPQARLKDSISLWARYLDIATTTKIENTMSVHIRHGDKPSVTSAEKKYTVFPAHILSLYQVYGFDKVHIMSDDASIGHQLSEMHKFVPIFSFPKEAFPGSQLQGKIAARHEQMQILLRNARISRSDGDEALALFTEVFLMSRASVFLGAVTSNIAQVIIELMATTKFPPVYHDRYGDTYSYCWFGENHMNFEKLANGFRTYYPVTESSVDPLAKPLNKTRLDCLRGQAVCT